MFLCYFLGFLKNYKNLKMHLRGIKRRFLSFPGA